MLTKGTLVIVRGRNVFHGGQRRSWWGFLAQDVDAKHVGFVEVHYPHCQRPRNRRVHLDNIYQARWSFHGPVAR